MPAKKTGLELLQSTLYNQAQAPEQGQVVISIDKQTICTLQNFITITAMEKAGKGKFLAPIIAGALTRDPHFNIYTRLPEGREEIALFDTEQGDFNFYSSILNIKKLSGLDPLPKSFKAFKMRKLDPEEILLAIKTYLEITPGCSLVVIDGLIDLIYSFNDEDKCARLVKYLMNLTDVHNCAMVASLHRSKTANTTIGHLGSFANRKAQSVLLVEKDQDRGTISLKPERLRDAMTFETIEIQYNKFIGTWEQTLGVPAEDKKAIRMKLPKPEEIADEMHATHIRRVFYQGVKLSYQEIIDGVCQNYGCGQVHAKQKLIPFLINKGHIFAVKGGYVKSGEAKLFVEANA